MKHNNKSLKTAGKSLIINSKAVKENCPDKFRSTILNPSDIAKEFCDNAEWYYFQKVQEKFINSVELGWHGLSLQEKKIINGLELHKIPAYLGYRFSFKEGIKRKDYKVKPIFALLEVVDFVIFC